MLRNACVLAALLASGCATTTDDRPVTADYIAEAILAPACGRAACHSSGVKPKNYAFDTVAAAKEALLRLVQPGNADMSELMQVMREATRTKGGAMPPDGPLPDADIALIRTWIDDGASGLK